MPEPLTPHLPSHGQQQQTHQKWAQERQEAKKMAAWEVVPEGSWFQLSVWPNCPALPGPPMPTHCGGTCVENCAWYEAGEGGAKTQLRAVFPPRSATATAES